MKFSIFAITALATATCSSCFVSATAAAAASRKRKITKKGGSPSGSQEATGATHKCDSSDHCSGSGGATVTGSSGQPGANCNKTSDFVIPSGLDHAVCRDGQCQSGGSGSSCGVISDCIVPPGLDHAVCRKGKCQHGVCYDYCGQDSDCNWPLICVGKTDIAKCKATKDPLGTCVDLW